MNTAAPRPTRNDVPGPRRGSVRVRSIRPTDAPALRTFYAQLSEESRRARFLHVCAGLDRAQSISFCTPDHDHQEGFVAIVAGPLRHEQIVGHLCIEPDDTNVSEVAIAVADAFQHRGIGHRLLAAGAAWAIGEAISRLTATMLTSNDAIHRLLVGLGLPTRERWVGGGIVEMTIDLARRNVAAA
jgi:GNAT superfamily N-acetyltransferase